jgi:hypothetical protein
MFSLRGLIISYNNNAHKHFIKCIIALRGIWIDRLTLSEAAMTMLLRRYIAILLIHIFRKSFDVYC